MWSGRIRESWENEVEQILDDILGKANVLRSKEMKSWTRLLHNQGLNVTTSLIRRQSTELYDSLYIVEYHLIV
jgi:hypothetical protein